MEKAGQVLGVEASNVLGKNRQGELLIRSSAEVLCGFDAGTLSLNWIKIDINGHEYKFENQQRLLNPGRFQREIGLARVHALFAEYDLPFDSPRQENLVELWMNQTGDVQAFRYEDFSALDMARMNEFFEDLKPTASQGVENARRSWNILGILNADNTFNRSRYEAIIQAWVAWKRVDGHHPFLSTLR